jgi:hypothetical protein
MMRFKVVVVCLAVLFFNGLFTAMSAGKVDKGRNYNVDICIYGGTSGGVIAAYTAKKCGKSVLLIEPGKRLGGMTTGGLGMTDIGNKQAITGLSREFYKKVGKEYGVDEQWKFEPSVALKVMQSFIDKGSIEVIYQSQLKKVRKKGNVIQSIVLRNNNYGYFNVTAKQFIDCTYEGDLMAMAGVSYTVGREGNNVYNETLNGVQPAEYHKQSGNHQFPDGVSPYKIPGKPSSGLVWGISKDDLKPRGTGDKKVQAYNFRLCLTDSAENRIPITRPSDYDSTKYELLARLFEAQPSMRNINEYLAWDRMPHRKTDINNRGGISTDMIGMNYDYPDGSYKKREKIFNEHLSYTKGLLYFMKADQRVPEVLRNFVAEWGYCKDEFKDFGYFTPQLYIRESRRMIGEYVMTEHNCTGTEKVEDGVGMAAYTMDSHNCQRIVVNGMVKNEGNVEVGGFPPYPVSYRSLTPKKAECQNLIVPVCLSASHIAYGSIRMEPVFMVLGESSAIASSMAIDQNMPVQEIDVKKLQEMLKNDPFVE